MIMDEISYSDEGLAGRDLFLAEFSEVLFYFEDADHEPFYEKLISIIAPEYLTSAIACLGGKDNVIKMALEKNITGKPRVFIVDKDFDDVLNSIVIAEGLIYIDRYCLENYLLSFPAILGVAIDRYALVGTKAHKDCADFEEVFSKIVTRYETLTRLFLVARKNRLSIATTKMPISEFSTGNSVTDILPQDFIDIYTNRLLDVAAASAKSDWITAGAVLDGLTATAFDQVKTGIDCANGSVARHLCGKHLFRMILRYIEIATGVSVDSISTPSLYMDVIGRIGNFRADLESVASAISATINLQRRKLS